jgi:hypothetical protein
VSARHNPFRSERIEALPFRFVDGEVGGWDDLLRRLTRNNGRGALVGPKGSGKTTLLEELGRRLTARGLVVTLVRLSSSHRELPTPRAAGPGDAVLIDGAEQLSSWRWLLLRFRMRAAGAFVVTVHRGGRLPTVMRTRTSEALVHDLVRALLPAGAPTPDPALVTSLFQRHAANVREVLRALYDDWQPVSDA